MHFYATTQISKGAGEAGEGGRRGGGISGLERFGLDWFRLCAYVLFAFTYYHIRSSTVVLLLPFIQKAQEGLNIFQGCVMARPWKAGTYLRNR